MGKAFEGWNVRSDGEFFLASRYPIRDVLVPPDLSYAQGIGGAHFVCYSLETPLGLVDVFNVQRSIEKAPYVRRATARWPLV